MKFQRMHIPNKMRGFHHLFCLGVLAMFEMAVLTNKLFHFGIQEHKANAY